MSDEKITPEQWQSWKALVTTPSEDWSWMDELMMAEASVVLVGEVEALRTRITALEAEQREFLAYAGTESLADAYNKMSSLSYHATAATDALESTKAHLTTVREERDAYRELSNKHMEGRVELLAQLAAALQRAEAAEASVAALREAVLQQEHADGCVVGPDWRPGYYESDGDPRRCTCRISQALASLPTAAAALRTKAGLAEEAVRWLRSPIDQTGFWTCVCCDEYNETVAPEEEHHKADCPVGRYRAATAPADGGGQG